MKRLVFTQDADDYDWRALPRPFKMGDAVFEYRGHTYGCTRDDLMYADRETIAVSENGETPFFTVPVEFLAYEDGTRPIGEYVRMSRRTEG